MIRTIRFILGLAMRRSTFLTLTTVVLSSSALIGSSAFAADAGTYRPGNSYNSITANSPDICEMQCSGDAQCRSWNYVRISEMAEGVCEFNDTLSSPVPSAISISGNNVSRGRSPRVVVGKTNTVRVGAPTVTQPRVKMARTTPVVTRAPSITPQSNAAGLSLMEQQRLNSQRGHNQIAAKAPTTRRAPARRNAPMAPQFRHSLEDAPVAAAPPRTANNAPASMTRPAMQAAPTVYGDPRLVRKLQQRQSAAQNLPSYPPAAPQTPPQVTASAGGLSAPPGVPPLSEPATANLGQSSYMRPSMAGAPPVPSQRRVSIPSELSPRPMNSGDSLFGSLYDDVKVPRPLDPSIAADPEAPIPTVSSVPTAKIQMGPLPSPR